MKKRDNVCYSCNECEAGGIAEIDCAGLCETCQCPVCNQAGEEP